MAKKSTHTDECVIESYKLLHLLRQTSEAVHRAREYELKRYKISPSQSAALLCIHSLDDQATPAELSRWLFRKPNSTTTLLNRMEKQGLIEKKADARRKNVIRLSLTPKGYEAYKHSIEFQTFFPLIEVLATEERKQLWFLLESIRLRAFQDLQLDVSAYSKSFDKPIIERND